MKPEPTIIDRILPDNFHDDELRYVKLSLQFNPFPRSGTANINGSDLFNRRLIPVDEITTDQIVGFVRDALKVNPIDAKDRFISATILGDYGSGKTQLLMYVRSVLGEVSTAHKGHPNPYVIYVDNPGVKLSELVGTIISKIGEDNFRKFIWSKIIRNIKLSDELRERLRKFQGSGGVLFHDTNPDPYSEENTVSYKQFLNSFTRYVSNTRSRKELDETLKEVLIRVLEGEVGDPVLAQYFYEMLSEDYGVNKTWEALASGTIKHLDKKVAHIIRYIVRLIKEQGYTDFFILVDEFEDITEGRLTKAQVDNYVYNLRTLLDEHREWCLLFAMTSAALRKLRLVSPPLADRISSRVILLHNLDVPQARKIVLNYLNLARESENEELHPFDLSGIEKLNELVEGNARRFLRSCHFIVERALEDLDADKLIDSVYVKAHFSSQST
jgi:hypothetical protein